VKWVAIATAPGELVAEVWRGMLVEEGFSAAVSPGDTMTSYLGVTPLPCRVMVPEDQAEEARKVLAASFGTEGDE
jgi:hypothetical protein